MFDPRCSSRSPSGCSAFGATAANAASPKVTPPSSITSAKQLLFCTDATYPPEEFYKGTKLVGSDIDIGTEIAKTYRDDREVPEHRLRRHHRGAPREEVRRDHQRHERHPRAAQAGRIRRLPLGRPVADGQEGQSRRASTRSRACPARRVSVEVGTTNKQFLDAESKLLTKKGKPAIKVVTFPKDTDAANALKTGRVDAYFGDAPVVAYYIKRDTSFAFAGSPGQPDPGRDGDPQGRRPDPRRSQEG